MPALLSPLPPDDFRKRWSVAGHPNLRIEAEYDDDFHRRARLYGYSVIDTSDGLLPSKRLLHHARTLAEIREWIRGHAQTVDPS